MTVARRMTLMIMPLRASTALHRYFRITLDSRLDPISAEHTDYEMVRRYAHLSVEHLAPYADRLCELEKTGTKLTQSGDHAMMEQGA